MKPDVILMDEPASALDPISTQQIEELCLELKEHYTIVIVTHNMQQASRISDLTAFFHTETDETGKRRGKLVEVGPTEQMFASPRTKEAQDYISGRFGWAREIFFMRPLEARAEFSGEMLVKTSPPAPPAPPASSASSASPAPPAPPAPPAHLHQLVRDHTPSPLSSVAINHNGQTFAKKSKVELGILLTMKCLP